MIEIKDIKEYRYKAEDYEKTEELKIFLRNLIKERDPFYLKLEELDKILHWKLLTQYGRQKEKRSIEITNEIAQNFTKWAFKITHANEDYETYLKIKTLMVPRGINVRIASAILALCFPEKYAVIDFRVWRQLFSEERDSYTINQYLEYLKKVTELAKILGWDPQEVDLAIWAYDKDKNP